MNSKKSQEHTFPDFLGIGGHRCGSSWLFRNLREHPGIWMSARKELHYFDRSPSYPSPSHLAEANLFRRLLSRKKHNRKFRAKIVRLLGCKLIHPNRYPLSWDIKYFLGHYSDSWYASLFQDGKDKVKGEITPAYSILDSNDVGHIRSIMPKVKIIFLLRNPVDRAWSSIRFDGHASLSDREIMQVVDGEALVLRSNYLRTISIWRNFFPSDQFFIGFLDEIRDDPEKLLLKLFNFLGVEAKQQCITNFAQVKVNRSTEAVMNDDLRVLLTEKYLSDIEELSRQMGRGYAKQWLAEARATMQAR